MLNSMEQTALTYLGTALGGAAVGAGVTALLMNGKKSSSSSGHKKGHTTLWYVKQTKLLRAKKIYKKAKAQAA